MQTVIEKILKSMDKSDLLDMRVRMFDFMASTPDMVYTMRQLIVLLGLPDNRRLLGPMMNVLFQYNLTSFDYNAKTYCYKDSPESRQLIGYINMLKAM